MEENNLLDKINKLSLPATILIAAVILGGFYFAVEYYKQRSIERQQQAEFRREDWEYISDKQALDICLADAEKETQKLRGQVLDYAKTPEYQQKQYDLSATFDFIDSELAKKRDECFKKYPQ